MTRFLLAAVLAASLAPAAPAQAPAPKAATACPCGCGCDNCGCAAGRGSPAAPVSPDVLKVPAAMPAPPKAAEPLYRAYGTGPAMTLAQLRAAYPGCRVVVQGAAPAAGPCAGGACAAPPAYYTLPAFGGSCPNGRCPNAR